MKRSSEMYCETEINEVRVTLSNNIELTVTRNKIYIRKVYPHCDFCGSIAEFVRDAVTE